MVIQIAMGIFLGFLFLAIFAFLLLGFAYIASKEENVPHFIEEPKKRHKTSVQDWWDRYDEDEDDYY